MSDGEQDFIDDVVEIGSPTPEIENDPLPPPDQGGPGPRNVSRLQMDFEEAQKDGKDKGYTVELINNDYELWSIKFYNLDVVPHPNQIAKYKEKYRRDYTPFKDQMEQYKKKYGQNYLELIFTFPPNYPNIAPFIRVRLPRFVMYTAHVTVGGSICMGSLTFKGWTPTRTISSLISEVFALMMSGEAGDKPPKLDLSTDEPYDLPGAIDGFRRSAEKHKWEIPNWTPTK